MKKHKYKTTDEVDRDLDVLRTAAAPEVGTDKLSFSFRQPDQLSLMRGLCVPSLSPKIKQVSRGEENRMADVATGLMFTSQKHPWPTGPLKREGQFSKTPRALGPKRGNPLAPYLQVDLRTLGQCVGRNVGSGILQIWSQGTYKWLRVIPRREFRENALSPVSEEQFQVFDDTLAFLTWSLEEDDDCAYQITGWKKQGIFVENLVRELESEEGGLREWAAGQGSQEAAAVERLVGSAEREWHDVVPTPEHDIRAFGFGESIQGNHLYWTLDPERCKPLSSRWRILLQLYCRQIPWNFAEGTAVVLYRRRPKTPDKSGTPLRMSNICEHGPFEYAMYWERWN